MKTEGSVSTYKDAETSLQVDLLKQHSLFHGGPSPLNKGSIQLAMAAFSCHSKIFAFAMSQKGHLVAL